MKNPLNNQKFEQKIQQKQGQNVELNFKWTKTLTRLTPLKKKNMRNKEVTIMPKKNYTSHIRLAEITKMIMYEWM